MNIPYKKPPESTKLPLFLLSLFAMGMATALGIIGYNECHDKSYGDLGIFIGLFLFFIGPFLFLTSMIMLRHRFADHKDLSSKNPLLSLLSKMIVFCMGVFFIILGIAVFFFGEAIPVDLGPFFEPIKDLINLLLNWLVGIGFILIGYVLAKGFEGKIFEDL